MSKPLEGIIMLDVTRVLAGPFCSMIFADLGAEVIKIEIPGKGDDSRSFPPFLGNESAYFMNLNRNKKSLTLNLKSEEGKQIFINLAKTADIVLENFRPGTMDALGLGYAQLSEVNNRLIYAACSGFGATGPYSKRACYDLIVQAMGGIMSITGPDENHPYKVGSSIGDIIAGLYTIIGILSALNFRNITGEGQFVDVSMLDCQLSILENAIARYFIDGINPKPIGNRHPSIAPFGEFESKEGSIVVCVGNDRLFRKFCEVLGLNELLVDENFKTNELRVIHVKKLTEFINRKMKLRKATEWLDRLNKAGIPCGPINMISDMLNDPQVLSRDMLQEVFDSQGNSLTMVNTPIKLSKSPGSIRVGAPLLGEHTREILKQVLHFSEEDLNTLENKGVI